MTGQTQTAYTSTATAKGVAKGAPSGAYRSPARPAAPLNRDQVIEICGRMDDLKIAAIIGAGATAAELMEARTWTAADDCMGAALQRAASGRVARLVELLKADEPDWDDR